MPLMTISILVGHPGKDSMVTIILTGLFWPKLRNAVRKFIRNCDVYGLKSAWRVAKAGFLRFLPIPQCIGGDLTIDFVKDLP